MKKINTDKVFTEMRDGVTATYPVSGRKYTMTHSDETADLFVTIGIGFAEDKVERIRDEVRLQFIIIDRMPILYGEVVIDGMGVPGNPPVREAIFKNEMPTALQAIRYADRELFTKYPKLDQTPVYIQFLSANPDHNKLYDYGTIGEYQPSNGVDVDIQ